MFRVILVHWKDMKQKGYALGRSSRVSAVERVVHVGVAPDPDGLTD